MRLTRKPTDFGRGPVPDDYAIYDDGKLIGRVYLSAHRLGEKWFWSITARFPASAYDSGYAVDLEAALAALKARWQRE